MKIYLAITTAIFGLLTILHVWRGVAEPSARSVWFVVITVLSALLCLWGGRLLVASRARAEP